MDLISVLMGTRADAAQLEALKRAVSSVLNQEKVEVELLICAAGADTTVQDWLWTVSDCEKRVRIVERAKAMLLGEKINACLNCANGRWIARMDDDDYSYPLRLNRQLAFLSDIHNCYYVGSWVREVGLYGARIRKLPQFPTLNDFRMTQPFVHPTLFFKREVLERVGGYSESRWQDHCDDYDLLLRLYQQGITGANIQEVLMDYSVARSLEQRRPYRFFVNEAVTRAARFSALKKLPAWTFYVVKPLVVGLIPRRTLYWLKTNQRKN